VEAPTQVRPDPLLVFIHIPKTAGTTVRSVIRTNEPGTRNRRPGANVFQGGGGVNTKALEKLRDEATMLDLDGVNILHGHNPLGIREYLEPAFPDRAFRYFTFLRDPVERSLSHYFRLRHRTASVDEDEPEEEDEAPPPPTDMTFDDAIEAGYLHDNLQTRMLSGDPEPFGEVTEDTLERAKRNVQTTFTLAGISERLDESLVLARRRLGWRSVLFDPGHRVNANRPRGAAIPQELRLAAEQVNRYDIELYRFAREEFDRAPERDDLEFQVELAALRAAKTRDETGLDVPPPPGFHAGEREWQLLLKTRARLLRLRHEASRRQVRTIRHGLPPTQAGVSRRRVKDAARGVRSGHA
jgi:Sulfotransferase family